MLDLILVATTIIFAVLFIVRTVQLNKIKREQLNNTSNSEAFSFEIENQNDEPLATELIDPLTELPNRIAFEDRFTHITSWSQRFQMKFGVLFLDIDKLSVVNKLDYQIGDKLLKAFAERIKGCIRQIDTLSRYAGDKFILLLPQLVKPETAAYVAQRIQDNIIQPFEIDGHSISINVYMGISIYPIDGTDLETLVKNARNATLQAKEQGKNKYQFYSPAIQAAGEREFNLIEYFKKEEVFTTGITLEYNPYFNIETNQISYIQATPTLTHPIFGMISEAEFFKIAEKSDKILQVTEFIIKTAFIQFKTWKSENIEPDKLLVDVSLKQVENPEFVQAIKKLLQELNVEPNKLILQISRGNLSTNITNVEKALLELSTTGIEVAVAVLALGHFALHRISHIPITYLKIDADLTKLLALHADNNFVVDRIIVLAADSKITVFADGVENSDEKTRLKALGCEVMGGKLFDSKQFTSSPMD